MPLEGNSNDYSPLFWYKRNPIYLTAFICAGLVATMLIATILDTANISSLGLFAFWPDAFWHGALWQFFTYPLLGYPNFFFLFGVLFLFFAGNEVEKYLGRKRYITLLGLLWFFPPLVMSAWQSPALPPFYYGSIDFTAAFVIAFATLYPNLEYWGWVPMKWVAAACLFLSSLGYLPRHNWTGLVILWGMCAIAFAYVRWLQLGAELPRPLLALGKIFRRKPKFKVVPRETSPREEVHDSIDPLLDKISKHGLSSLTAREKAQLERARKSLLEKKD